MALNLLSRLSACRDETSSPTLQRRSKEMRKAYAPPKLVEYGKIADCTFTTPNGQVKGCTSDCHLDSFNENSANSTTAGS